MRFNNPNNYVLASFAAANGLAQHAISFANTRSIPKKHFEEPLLLLGSYLFKPLLGGRGMRKRLVGFTRHGSYNSAVNRRWLLHFLRYSFVTGAVGCVVIFYARLIHVNPTTVALTFLLGILFVANR